MPGSDGHGAASEPLRLSDAERNGAAEHLTASYSDGRLSHDEFSSRLDEVYAAGDATALQHAFRGLPVTPPVSQSSVSLPSQRSLRSRVERGVAVCSPAGLCTAIWGITPGHYFWPEWVWLPTGMVLLGGYLFGRRRRERDRLRALMPVMVAPPLPLSGSTEEMRAILSVVFVDIVGSTESAAALGDRRWREVLDQFEQVVDGTLAEHHGHKLFTKGDEVVATFRAPAGAIGFASALRDAVHALQLAVRCGIHTGEIEARQGDMSGITLHIGQRVSAMAAADEIIVSSTVRDIAYGSGIQFADHGEHELKGLQGSWHLYSVRSPATA